MPSYQNGSIPLSLLVTFERGYNSTDGNWHHSLSPATYARHRALVALAKQRTGRDLRISSGWSAYRPLEAQYLARRIHGVYAAVPGTSSHGGFWEGRQTLAMDYGNWGAVYAGFGFRDAFAADCRAVGLSPNLIVPARGYPDEPWHVVDLNPWSAVPAFGGSEDFPNTQEEEMTQAQVDEIKDIAAGVPGAGAWLVRYAKSAEFGNVFALYQNARGKKFRVAVGNPDSLKALGEDIHRLPSAELQTWAQVDRDGVVFHPGEPAGVARSTATGNVFRLFRDNRGNQARQLITDAAVIAGLGDVVDMSSSALWAYAPINQG